MTGRYAGSSAMLHDALRVHATGPLPFALGMLPLAGVPHYFRRAHGAVLEDADGNRLVDLHNAWGAVILGHGAPEVEEAVLRVLRDGVVALPTRYEAGVAERVIHLSRWGETVRFARTGSDGLAAAIRLARACTGRDLVAVSGYHGWHDSLAAAMPWQRGIPAAVRRVCLRFDSSDPGTLEALFARHTGRIAATVLEPARPWPPDAEKLNAVGTLARRHGAVVIHDEVASGLRAPPLRSLGIESPDVSVLGKGIANGLPLAAMLGARRVVGAVGPDLLLFSASTHDAATLAAAEAVLARLAEPKVAGLLANADAQLRSTLSLGIEEGRLLDRLQVAGHPGVIVVQPKPASVEDASAIRLLLVQELLARGIYCLGPIYVSAAHGDFELSTVRNGVRAAIDVLAHAIHARSVTAILQLARTDRIALRR